MTPSIYWRRLYILLAIGSFFYASFYFIFYRFLGTVSIEGLIGFSILFLFYLIYRLGGVHINRFLLSISRNVWFFFSSLISLTYMIENLFIKTIDSSKKLMVFQFISNNLVFVEIEKAFNELNALLLNKYILNIISSELFFKRLVIKKLFEKNLIIDEVIIFNGSFLVVNSYIFNNVIGWFTKE